MWDWSNCIGVRVVGRCGSPSERLVAALATDHGLNIVSVWPNGDETSRPSVGDTVRVSVYDAGYVDRQAFDDIVMLHRLEPDVAILVVAEGGEADFILTSLRAGARGCVLFGPGTVCDLGVAIRSLSRGQGFLCPETAKIVLERCVCLQSAGGRGARLDLVSDDRVGLASEELDRLTPRERQVLKLVAEGHSTPIIAGLLDISAKTVEGHRGRIMAKLKVHNVAGLVRHAIRAGVIAA